MLTWLASVLRNADLQVIELDGWQQRGDPDIEVEGVVCHHTATGQNWTDESVARLLRDGRPDLPGPLSQLGLDRAGRFWLIAAGRCNHNGYGVWGNDSIGIEAFNDGQGEPWPAVQVDAFERGCAALVTHLGLTVNEVRGHKETDPDRKIDPTLNMDQFRTHVAQQLNRPEEPSVFIAKCQGTPEVWLFEPGRMTHLKARADVTALATAAGLPTREAVVSFASWTVLIRGRQQVR